MTFYQWLHTCLVEDAARLHLGKQLVHIVLKTWGRICGTEDTSQSHLCLPKESASGRKNSDPIDSTPS